MSFEIKLHTVPYLKALTCIIDYANGYGHGSTFRCTFNGSKYPQITSWNANWLGVPQVYDIRAQAMLVQCQRNAYFCKAMLVQSSAMFTQCWINSNKKMSPAVHLETNLYQNSPDFKKVPIYHLSLYIPPCTSTRSGQISSARVQKYLNDEKMTWVRIHTIINFKRLKSIHFFSFSERFICIILI